MSRTPAVLFVCLGNICRSPLAEAAFRKAAAEAGLDADADSAGTAAYHVGEPPDPRSIAIAARHGVDIAHYRGRQIVTDDFHRFTHILALDHSNLANIRRIAPAVHEAHLALLLDIVPGQEGAAVPDPYYDGEGPFEYTWRIVWPAAQALVARLSTSD